MPKVISFTHMHTMTCKSDVQTSGLQSFNTKSLHNHQKVSDHKNYISFSIGKKLSFKLAIKLGIFRELEMCEED